MLRMIMSRGRKMMMLRMMMRRPIPRPRPTVCASLGSPNALGQNTRSILCEKLQEKCRAPDGSRDRDPHLWEPAQSTCTRTCHMSQQPSYAKISIKKAAPQMDPETATHTCGSLRSQHAHGHVTCHNSHRMQKFQSKRPRPRWIWRPRPTLCTSLRNRNAHGHVTRAILRGNLQEKCRAPDGSRTSREPAQSKCTWA